MLIEHLALSKLQPNPRNARVHSDKQVQQLVGSISEFGFNNPVLIDQSNVILCGHARVEAARRVGLETVPVLRIDHLNEAQKRAFMLADNKIALSAGWDTELLKLDFMELMAANISFDLEVTGFATAEVDLIVDGPSSTSKFDPCDVVPPLQPKCVSRLGDLWDLGNSHKLICGDARDAAIFAALMGDERARVVFTDPPYNIAIDGNVSGNGAVKHGNFAMASGEMTEAQFVEFLRSCMIQMVAYSYDGSIHYLCMDWRHTTEMQAAARDIYSELINICVWNKSNGGLGSFYRSKHEFVFVYKVGAVSHVNTIELGKNGRYRTNVWDYAGVNSFGANRNAELEMHPTVKPTALVIDAIKDCSRRNDIVLDPFSGSGTTIIAAQKCRRRARAIEIDPHYVDVAIRRWQHLTGERAFLASTGQTFAEIENERIANQILAPSERK